MKKLMFSLLSVVFIGMVVLGTSVFFLTSALTNTLKNETKKLNESVSLISDLNVQLMQIQKSVAFANLKLSKEDVKIEEKILSDSIDKSKKNIERLVNGEYKWMHEVKISIKESSKTTAEAISAIDLIKELNVEFENINNQAIGLTTNHKLKIEENEKLAEIAKDLSKIYRDSFYLTKYGEDNYKSLGRAVVTVIGSKSVRDLQFAGRKVFSEVDMTYKSLIKNPLHASKYNELSTKFQECLDMATKVYSSSGDFDIFIGKLKEKIEPLNQLVEKANNLFEEGENKAISLAEKTKWISLLTSIALILICLVVGIIITVKITKQLSIVSDTLNESVQNTLSIGEQLGNQSQRLASSSKQQATAVTEISSSLSEITAMVDSSLSNTQDTLNLSKEIANLISQGSEKISQLNQAVNEIAATSKRITELSSMLELIGSKTKLIDEIVLNTQLLSFNASIEAERAGEHGRGFSVVASEVSNLAKSSGQSSKEIGSIVKESIQSAKEAINVNQEKIKHGVAYCSELVDSFRRISNICDKILNASQNTLSSAQQQSEGIKLINRSIFELDTTTQSNASSALDCSNSSKSLNMQGTQLSSVVTDLSKLVGNQKKIINSSQHENSFEQGLAS